MTVLLFFLLFFYLFYIATLFIILLFALYCYSFYYSFICFILLLFLLFFYLFYFATLFIIFVFVLRKRKGLEGAIRSVLIQRGLAGMGNGKNQSGSAVGSRRHGNKEVSNL